MAMFRISGVVFKKGFWVNSVHVAHLLSIVFSAVIGMVAPGAAADSVAPQAPLELTADNLASVVDPMMTEWIDGRKGAGAVVVVVTRDAPVFAKGYGFSDIKAKKLFTADTTLVRPGSISKLFTGIAVMQLVDAGKVDLDRDVNGYIDFVIPTAEGDVPVTLRRLLTHRAGFEEHWKGLFSSNGEPEPLGRWLAENLPRRLFPQGDVEAYSNYGLALAGYVVERASGEPFVSYVERHVLEPLGMSHSTFQQPLPDELVPLMAKGYRTSDQPPLGFFETIAATPAGGLSATGTDMGRFMRALMNGGALDGASVLAKVRLDQMMAPSNATPAGYLGLVFFGTKVAGHDSIGHGGETLTFFSDLTLFPEQGVGIFVCRDGIGEIKEVEEIPDPEAAIAERFLIKTSEGDGPSGTTFSTDSDLAGVYNSSRRAESSWVRLYDLVSQRLVKIDSAENVSLFSAIWPFGDGETFKPVGRNLYEGPASERFAFINDPGSQPYIAEPALRLQRVPWFLDVRWIAPALAVSTGVAALTILAWPVAALWRHWRNRPWSQDADRRKYLAVRLVLLVDVVVIVATLVLFFISLAFPTVLNDTLDRLLVTLYALAWLGALGAILTVWTAVVFWRNRVGSRWSRIHHSLIAASTVMIAWFFLTFRIAGTTLTY